VLAEFAGDHPAQDRVGDNTSGLGSSPPHVCLPVGVPRLIAAIRLPVPGDLPVHALIALPDPGSDQLHRLPSSKPVSDLDPIIL